MKKILTTGSLAYDYIMDFPGTFEENILPQNLKTLSLSFLVDNFSKNFGGVAGNISYTLSLLGEQTAVFSSAGEKDFSDYKKHLEAHHVDLSFVNIVPDQFTANAFIMTDKSNCQFAGFYPGAISEDDTLSLHSLPLADFSLLIIGPTTMKSIDTFAKEAKELHVPYLFDPAQQLTRLSAEEIKNGIRGAEIVIANDYELELMMKKTEYTKNDLLQQSKVIVTTMGEKGSLIETADRQIQIGIAQVVEVRDPTGAGDAYIAGFAAGYTDGKDIKICGQMGATAASFAIEQYGTQNHRFTKEEFAQRYMDAFKERIDLALIDAVS